MLKQANLIISRITIKKTIIKENWAKFRDEVNSAARETIDVLKKHHQDWFDDNDTEIQGLLAVKYTAHKGWLADKQSDNQKGQVSLSQG